MAMFLLMVLMVGVVDMKTLEVKSRQTVQKRSSVCYGALGCFSTDPPFTSAQRPVSVAPESPDKILTKFQLYTREVRNTAQNLDARYPDIVTTAWTHFSNKPTQFIVHGFLDTPSISTWLSDIKNELLTHGDYNVVIVDWSHGNLPPYDQASANTRIVGAQIAAVINVLIKSAQVTAGSFHLIGHSLGSHICGYAGEKVPGLGRITGLDPAGPYFENTDKVVRLDPTDAIFVDSIHTDAKNLLQLGKSYLYSRIRVVSTVRIWHERASWSNRFFPNLGHDQPGCTRDPIANIIQNGIIQGIEEEGACNHLRSIKFFKESINSQCPFLGFPCASEDDFQKNLCHSCTASGCAALGFNANQHIPPSGQQVKYYLTTGDKAPFCRYHLDVSLKFSTSQGAEERGTVSVAIGGNKGSSGKIPLGSSPVNFQPGHTYKYYVMVPTDIGSVQSVTFSWEHSSLITDPLNWDPLGLRHPKLYLAEIDVFTEEAGADVHLCSGAQGIETGHTLTVSTKC